MIFLIVKHIFKSVVSAIIYPIATLVSTPKMLRIYFDRDIQSRFFLNQEKLITCKPCCSRRYPNFFTEPSPSEIKKMKLLAVSRYKISLSYLRSQLKINVVKQIILLSAVPILLPLSLILPDVHNRDADEFNNSIPKCWIGLTILSELIIPSMYGFLRTLLLDCLDNSNNTSFISACDEILFPLKKLCCIKHPTRMMDRLISKRTLELAATKENLDSFLSTTRLPALNNEFNQFIKIEPAKKLIRNTTQLPNELVGLICDYACPKWLIFSSGYKTMREHPKEDIHIDILSDDTKFCNDEKDDSYEQSDEPSNMLCQYQNNRSRIYNELKEFENSDKVKLLI